MLCFGKFPVAIKFTDEKRGRIKFFNQKLFVSKC